MKSVTQDHVLFDSISMKCPNLQRQEVDRWLPSAGGNRKWLLMGMGFAVGGQKCSKIRLQ